MNWKIGTSKKIEISNWKQKGITQIMNNIKSTNKNL